MNKKKANKKDEVEDVIGADGHLVNTVQARLAALRAVTGACDGNRKGPHRRQTLASLSRAAAACAARPLGPRPQGPCDSVLCGPSLLSCCGRRAGIRASRHRRQDRKVQHGFRWVRGPSPPPPTPTPPRVSRACDSAC